MENIKILVFDIDGTLVDRSKQTVEESAVKVINEARDKGYHILIATGRSFFFIHEDVRKSINTEFYVTVNGACLNDNEGNIITSYPFSKESLEAIIEYCAKNKFPLAIKYEDHMGVYGDYDFFVENYVGKDHPAAFNLIDDNHFHSVNNSNPLGIFYFAPENTLDDVVDKIPELNFIPADNDTIEAIQSNVDKTKNIEDVLDRLNLSWDNVIAFGDGNNDVKMLQLAKVGVAMGNASDYVKSQANYVTDTVLNDGIKKAFDYLKIL